MINVWHCEIWATSVQGGVRLACSNLKSNRSAEVHWLAFDNKMDPAHVCIGVCLGAAALDSVQR